MTSRQMYEALLIELNKTDAPNILLEDFNYFANKAINQYINKRYNIYDVNQQTTDDLRVLKATAVLPVTQVNSELYEGLTTAGDGKGLATYEAILPSDYLHILNCICIYNVERTFKCYNKGNKWRAAAKRLTADAYSLVLDNFWNRPTYKRPYYYIHNVNTQSQGISYQGPNLDPVSVNITNRRIPTNEKTDYISPIKYDYNNSNSTRNNIRRATNILYYLQKILGYCSGGDLITPEGYFSPRSEGLPDANGYYNIVINNITYKCYDESDGYLYIENTIGAGYDDLLLVGIKGGKVYILQNTGLARGKKLKICSKWTILQQYIPGLTPISQVDNRRIFLINEQSTYYKIKYNSSPYNDNISTFYGIDVIRNGSDNWNEFHEALFPSEEPEPDEPNPDDPTPSEPDPIIPTPSEDEQVEFDWKDAWGNEIIDLRYETVKDSQQLFTGVLTSNGIISNVERSSQVRYGNASQVRMEIRYGTDNSVFRLEKVLVDYIKAPQNIRLTQEQLDLTEDSSQMLEYPDYVCQEIINELVHIVMENIGDPKLQTHPIVSLSIANPAQQLTEPVALPATT